MVVVFQRLGLFFQTFAPDSSLQLPEEWTLASHWMAPLPAAPLHNDLLEPWKAGLCRGAQGPVVASWLALPPFKGRSSEERPGRLSRSRHRLLVAVNSRSLGKAAGVSAKHPSLPGAGQGTRQGWDGGSWMPGSLCLWLHPRAGLWGLGALPWYGRGCQTQPCARQGRWLSKCPTCGHGAQSWHALELGTWDAGECRKNPNSGKKPQPPQKIQTNPESLEQQGENLNFVEEPSSLSLREKLEFCGICDVAINEELALMISFAFHKKIKYFLAWGGLLGGHLCSQWSSEAPESFHTRLSQDLHPIRS